MAARDENLNEYFEKDSIFRLNDFDNDGEFTKIDKQLTDTVKSDASNNVDLDEYFDEDCIFRQNKTNEGLDVARQDDRTTLGERLFPSRKIRTIVDKINKNTKVKSNENDVEISSTISNREESCERSLLLDRTPKDRREKFGKTDFVALDTRLSRSSEELDDKRQKRGRVNVAAKFKQILSTQNKSKSRDDLDNLDGYFEKDSIFRQNNDAGIARKHEQKFFPRPIRTLLNTINKQSKLKKFNEDGVEISSTGSNREESERSLLVDRNSTNRGATSGKTAFVALDTRFTRSSEELDEEHPERSRENFYAKFEELLSPASKSKSRDSLDDHGIDDTTKKWLGLNDKIAFKELIPRSSPRHFGHIAGIAATNATCWLFLRDESKIIRVTHNLVIQEKIRIPLAINDLAFDNEGRLYASCPRSKVIHRIDAHSVGETFRELRGYPRCIAYNSFKNEIVVCVNKSSPTAVSNENIDDNAVIRLSVKSEHKILQKTCKSLSHLSCPVRVSVNCKTADYVFLDFKNKNIVIFDRDLKFRHIIAGWHIFESEHLSRHPVVCCDLQGRIFAFNNCQGRKDSPNCVVLDEDGNVLEKIYLRALAGNLTRSASFDSVGRLWIASDNALSVYEV